MSDTTQPDLTVVEEQTAKVAEPTTKKADLLKRVMEITGKKQSEVKDTFEATIAVLGAALGAGEQVQVPPLGRIKINKIKTVANGKVLSARIRMSDETASKE